MPSCPSASRRLSRIFSHSAVSLFLCLAWAAAAQAEGDALARIAPAPDWTEAKPWQAPAEIPANPTGQDFLLVDEQTNLATEENYHHNVYQVVTDQGRENAAQVYFYFDPSYQTLTIHQLKLVRGTETSDRLDPAKIQVLQQERDLDRQMYNGERSALLILDDVRLGDIIDVAYTVRGRNPVFGGKFIDTASVGWATPVHLQHYRLLVPPERKITAKQIGTANLVRTEATRDGSLDLAWTRRDSPILETEEQVPGTVFLYPFLEFSEFRSWGEVVDWALPLYAEDPAPTPLLDAVVARLRAGDASAEQKAVDALAFVQQEVRYLGIEMGAGSHRPSAPEEVLRRRFGDCKDKARLLCAILQRLGHQAAPALVNSYRREAVRERLPSPYAFDHVIVALEWNGTRYLLDPTISYQRGDGLALRHVGRYGPYLRIAAEPVVNLENARPGVGDLHDSDTLVEFVCKSFSEPTTVTVTTTASGRAAESLRAYFATSTIDQIGRQYLNYYTRFYPTITRAAPVEFTDHPRTNSFRVVEHYVISRWFERKDGSDLWRGELQPAAMWEQARTSNLTQRRLPYAIGHPLKIRERFDVTLPEDWSVTATTTLVEDLAFKLQISTQVINPRRFIRTCEWESGAYQVNVDRLEAFSKRLAEARDKLGWQLTWRPAAAKPAVVPPPPPRRGLNLPMAILAAVIGVAGAVISWRLVRRRNPIQPEPPVLGAVTTATDPYSYKARQARAGLDGIGGWLILVALGLFIRPFVWGYILVDGRKAYFDQAVWDVLTRAQSDQYNPSFALVAPLELAFTVFLFSYSLLLIVLFFRRSHLFPRTIQIYLVIYFGYTLFVLWDVSALGHKLGFANYQAVVQGAAVMAVWIPYFQVSRRVKDTFIR